MAEESSFREEWVPVFLGALRAVDIALATRLHAGSALAQRPSNEELASPRGRLFWLAALVSHAQSRSHTGLYVGADARLGDCLTLPPDTPELSRLQLSLLIGSAEALLTQFVGRVVKVDIPNENATAPFVYNPESKLLYLRRWYALEAELAECLRERLGRARKPVNSAIRATFMECFSPGEIEANPWQAVACLSALEHDLALITGGPGTGKTTTVARLIALLLSMPEGERPAKIHMVAPTGKAADRMREAFGESFERILKSLPESKADELRRLQTACMRQPSTLQSFLGMRPLKGFSHHEGNQVDCDLLIVDEASMVDLELFIALFRGVPGTCKVVLLGDRNQLAAVEAGNVFADLTRTDASGSLNHFSQAFLDDFETLSGSRLESNAGALPVCGDQVTELVVSYRFSADSEVGRLASLLLAEGRLPGAGDEGFKITWMEDDWNSLLRRQARAYREKLEASPDPSELLEALAQRRILCAVRQGDAGVTAINGLFTSEVFGGVTESVFPRHGLPFIVTQNEKSLGLWNGDNGVFLRNPEGVLAAFFPPREGHEEAPRQFDPYALPDWEPAFALTIHKSQGSEYDSVVVVLPETRRPFISWELVYTGITRARKDVRLIIPQSWAGQPLPRTRRVSGLLHQIGASQAEPKT